MAWAGSRTVAWLRSTSDVKATGDSATAISSLKRLQALVAAAVDPEDTVVPDVPEDVVADLRTRIVADPYAMLASLYESLMDGPSRRALGTFFTPRSEAAATTELYSSSGLAPDSVVDVGAGVGIFTAAAMDAWPGAAITAVDLNPATLALQRLALHVTERGSHVDLVEADFTRWITTFNPAGSVLYLGNPPYTRWQLIPAEERARVLELTKGSVGSRANLSTIILGATLARMRPQDGLAMILPAGWMHASYGHHLRQRMLDSGRTVEVRLADSWRFAGAVVDAAVVVIRPRTSRLSTFTVSSWNGADTRQVVSASPMPTDPAQVAERSERGPVTTPLGRFVRVRRGGATGANWYFLLDQAAAERSALHARWLTPVVRRLRTVDQQVAPIHGWLLNAPVAKEHMDADLVAYIAAGEAARVHDATLCQRRPRWWDLSKDLVRPDVAIGALGRGRFHIYPMDGRVAITNNLFGLFWRADVNADQRAALVGWLRSAEGQTALLRAATPEADGLYRLSPRRLGEIEMPLEVFGSSDVWPEGRTPLLELAQ